VDTLQAKPESKYKLEKWEDGWKIWAVDRPATYIGFSGDHFTVASENGRNHRDYSPSYGLFELGRIITETAKLLMSNWKRPAEKETTDKQKKLSSKIAKWAYTQTGKAIAKKMRSQWADCIAKGDPLKVGAQRSYYAACGKFNSNLINPALYNPNCKYVLSDIINYRAAAMTVDDLSVSSGELNGWYANGCYDNDGYRNGRTPSKVYNWMEIYSIGQKPNSSLRKTLMHLPGGIPYHLLRRIGNLDRPIYTRIELLTYLYLQSVVWNNNHRRDSVLARSTRKDIIKACRAVQESCRTDKASCNLRKSKNLLSALGYIFDCTEDHNGNIVGLAHKSIHWHRDHRYLQESKSCKYIPETETAKPPIALPADKRIRLLAKVNEVFDESVAMAHCVSGYAERAVEGRCYLFHVDYLSESATVEVSRTGQVVQSKGPHNSANKATKWAERKLTEWGKAFPSLVCTAEEVELPF
jgi:hypothetical protein